MTEPAELITELRILSGRDWQMHWSEGRAARAIALALNLIESQADEIDKLATHRDVLIERRDEWMFRAERAEATLAAVDAEAQELTRQGYPTGVLLRLLDAPTPPVPEIFPGTRDALDSLTIWKDI